MGIALQKKLELKDELTKELATKADLLTLREEFLGEIKVLRQEMQTIKVEIEGTIETLRFLAHLPQLKNQKAIISGSSGCLTQKICTTFSIIFGLLGNGSLNL